MAIDPVVPELFPASVRARAIHLDHLHIREVAWSAADALTIVELLRDSATAILGGDVLINTDRGYVHEYSNWHTDPLPNEDWRSFAERSRQETRSYLAKFPDNGDGAYAYVLVLGAA